MKRCLLLAVLGMAMISCGGKRNASPVTEPYNPPWEKPIDQAWSILSHASILNDHQVQMTVNRYFEDNPNVEYRILIDEKLQVMKAYAGAAEVDFGKFVCLSEVGGLCRAYSIELKDGSRLQIRRQNDLQVTTRTANAETKQLYPLLLLQVIESSRNVDYVATAEPTIGLNPVIYRLEGIAPLPEVGLFATALDFGLTGSLKDSIGFYDLSWRSISFSNQITTVSAEYQHLLTGEKEHVEWLIESAP